MPSIEWTGIDLINISNQCMGSVWYLNGHQNRTEPFVRLLFPHSYGVRHRFLKKMHFFDCMMDPPEKHWRACKRGALPTEL